MSSVPRGDLSSQSLEKSTNTQLVQDVYLVKKPSEFIAMQSDTTARQFEYSVCRQLARGPWKPIAHIVGLIVDAS